MNIDFMGVVRRFTLELRGSGRGWMISTVALGWFVVVGMMLTLPALLPQIRAEFAISNATAGFAVTVLWLVYGALQFPAGLLTDRIGERWLLLGSMAIGTVVSGVFVFAPSFPGFLVACGLLGVVAGLFATPRVTLLSRHYPERSGTAIGTVMAIGNIGAAVFPIVGGVIAAAFSWRLGFGVSAPVFLLAFLGIGGTIPRDDGAVDRNIDQSTSCELSRFLRVFGSREVILVAVGFTLTFFTFQGLTAFLTTFLTSVKGLDGGISAILYGALFITAAVAQPITGRIADEVGKRIVLVIITGLYAVLIGILVTADTFLSIAAVVVLLGVQRGGTPVATAYLAASLPEDIRGAGYGFLRTVLIGVSSTAAVIVGLFVDAELFDVAFLALSGLATVAAASYFFLPPSEPV